MAHFAISSKWDLGTSVANCWYSVKETYGISNIIVLGLQILGQIVAENPVRIHGPWHPFPLNPSSPHRRSGS